MTNNSKHIWAIPILVVVIGFVFIGMLVGAAGIEGGFVLAVLVAIFGSLLVWVIWGLSEVEK